MSMAHLVDAITAHCDQQERWAKAEFNANPQTYKGIRGEMPEAKPWRSIMGTTILHTINVLEDMGLYDGPEI